MTSFPGNTDTESEPEHHDLGIVIHVQADEEEEPHALGPGEEIQNASPVPDEEIPKPSALPARLAVGTQEDGIKKSM